MSAGAIHTNTFYSNAAGYSLAELDRDQAVVLIPAGRSNSMGPHWAIDTDIFEGVEFSERSAKSVNTTLETGAQSSIVKH